MCVMCICVTVWLYVSLGGKVAIYWIQSNTSVSNVPCNTTLSEKVLLYIHHSHMIERAVFKIILNMMVEVGHNYSPKMQQNVYEQLFGYLGKFTLTKQMSNATLIAILPSLPISLTHTQKYEAH